MDIMGILSTALSIIVALLVLGVMVFVHESGHYLAGRYFKLSIVEFAIGFGPKIIKWAKKGIDYSLRVLPVGGFVRFYGEDEDNDDPDAMNNQAVHKRFFTIFAGPLFNVIFALILGIALFCGYGQRYMKVHDYSMDNAPAQTAGILPGDMIIAVNGKDVILTHETSSYVTDAAAKGEQIRLTILRDGQEIELSTGYKTDEASGRPVIGIVWNEEQQYPEYGTRYFGFFEAIGFAFQWIWTLVRMMVVFLGDLIFRGIGLDGVTGPVGTVATVGSAVQSQSYNFASILELGALISMNLGVINLVPFPALDGSRLVFLGIEGVRRKPVNRKVEGVIHFVGLVILMGFMVLLTINDIGRIVSSGG